MEDGSEKIKDPDQDEVKAENSEAEETTLFEESGSIPLKDLKKEDDLIMIESGKDVPSPPVVNGSTGKTEKVVEPADLPNGSEGCPAPDENSTLSRGTNETPSPTHKQQSPPESPQTSESSPSSNGKGKRPAPLRMTSAGKRQRSGSSEHKIPQEHQRSLREFYEAGGRDYKEYLNWLSAMGSVSENSGALPCDERKAETETVHGGSPSLLCHTEPPKLINIMETRITEQHLRGNQRSIHRSLGGVPFGHQNVVNGGIISPDAVEDATVLDLSNRGPAPQTKQKLFELLSTKAGKKQTQPAEGESLAQRKEGLLYDTSKHTSLPQSTPKHSSLMAKLLTESSCFVRDNRHISINRGREPVLAPRTTGIYPAPPVSIGNTEVRDYRSMNGDGNRATAPRSEGTEPRRSPETRSPGQMPQYQYKDTVSEPRSLVNRQESRGRDALPPPKKRRGNLSSNNTDGKGSDGKSEPKAVWPFLEEIIVRSLARSPPRRSLSKLPKPVPEQEKTPNRVDEVRQQPAGVPPPISNGPMGMTPMPPMLALAPPCMRQPSPDPPLLAPQQPIPLLQVAPVDPVLPPPSVTPPDFAPPNRDTPRMEECTSASDKDLLSWDVDQVVNFVGSVQKCHEYAEVFRDQEIDGLALSQLSEEHLVRFFQMRLGPAIRLRLAVTNKLKDLQR